MTGKLWPTELKNQHSPLPLEFSLPTGRQMHRKKHWQRSLLRLIAEVECRWCRGVGRIAEVCLVDSCRVKKPRPKRGALCPRGRAFFQCQF